MALEVGTKVEGKVTGITNFGAFVELPGGVTGLVHISEIADNYVKDVKDHLKLEDIITVKVINVDKDGKIGLSIRRAVDKPAESRPHRPYRRDDERGSRGAASRVPSFEEKMNKFLRDSEERISSLKKNTESKRGGRGARRY
jgi:S1 RNA binding domain protein